MTVSQRVILLSALNVLLLLSLALGLTAPSRTRVDERPLVAADAGTVVSLSIETQLETVELVRDERWEIVVDDRRLPARFDRIELMLDDLVSARLISRVTEDPAQHERLGVAGPEARRLTVRTGTGERSFVVGAASAPAGTLFLRHAGDPVVWLARSAADFYLRQSSSFWAYLRLYPEDVGPVQVVRLSVETETATFELVRDALDTWTLLMAGVRRVADRQAVASLARQVADLVGRSFYETDAFERLPLTGRFSFTLADARSFAGEVRYDGDVHVVKPIGERLPGDTYSGLLYTVERTVLARLFPDPGTLSYAEPLGSR